MQKESDYLVRNPKLIVEYLTDILKKKCLISAHFGENNASFLTVITKLDPKTNSLNIDSAPTELLNKELLNSAKVLFRTEIDGIQVSFSGKNIKKSKTAFEMPLPNVIFRLQRRQFYRVHIPLSHTGSYCKIPYRAEGDAGAPFTQIATVKLADLSISGFAFLNPGTEFAGIFETGKSFTECSLYLHEGPHSNIGFVIKNVTEIKMSTTTTQQRVGCLFTDVTPTFEPSIQCYMREIERQIKNIG